MKNKCCEGCQEIYNIRHVTKSIKYLVTYLIPWRRRRGKLRHLTSDFSKFEFRSEDWDLVHQVLSTIRAGTMSDVCQHLWRPWKLLFIYMYAHSLNRIYSFRQTTTTKTLCIRIVLFTKKCSPGEPCATIVNHWTTKYIDYKRTKISYMPPLLSYNWTRLVLCRT